MTKYSTFNSTNKSILHEGDSAPARSVMRAADGFFKAKFRCPEPNCLYRLPGTLTACAPACHCLIQAHDEQMCYNNTANQLGVQDFGAIVSIVAGLNVLPTRTKPRGAIEGTSLASRGSRKVFGIAKFPWGIQLPSVIGGYPPSTLKIKMVAKISAFTGRAIPVVGWIILASDVSQIAYRTVRDYNRIARGSDKIW